MSQKTTGLAHCRLLRALGPWRLTVVRGLRHQRMDSAEREAFKAQLRLMAAGRGDGIDWVSSERWAIEGLRDPVAFFRHLDRLIPVDSILYLEGTMVLPVVAEFYEANRARGGAVGVVRDMIFPVPEIFHVQLSTSVLEMLIALLGQHPQQRCFTHVKAYREEKLLFAFHDAFDGSPLLVCDRISAERVQAFCGSTGATCRRERNENKRDPEVLRRLLAAMENPISVRMLWPWWKKALLFWRK